MLNVYFSPLWRTRMLCAILVLRLSLSKSTWMNTEGQRYHSEGHSCLQRSSPEIFILLIQCLFRWMMGSASLSNFARPFYFILLWGREVNRVLVEPINGPYPPGWKQNRMHNIMGYKISDMYLNILPEVCLNFISFAFERKLEADIQLLCFDVPDYVFKHICSSELWTGFFGGKTIMQSIKTD